LAPKSAR